MAGVTMAQNILKSKTGKLGMIVVIILIFIIGLLWINGNEAWGRARRTARHFRSGKT